MKISLLTDAPKYNLALMKLSAWHKANGDEVCLNEPIFTADYTYASVLFEWNKKKFIADEYGGPAYVTLRGRRRDVCCIHSCLPEEIENTRPDLSLYGLDFSIGYTYRPCYNLCSFCIVPLMDHPDINHHSIWDFHRPEFKKICLLNNNTFQDSKWKETFEEIWDADLSVIDENGYDLRLLDDERADALYRTKWATPLHFAWDRIQDEVLIRNGLDLIVKHKLRSTANGVYVLIGYNTTEEEDLHRCQVIHDYGLTPYPMPYESTRYTRAFKRFVNLHYYRKYSSIKEAWKDYR